MLVVHPALASELFKHVADVEVGLTISRFPPRNPENSYFPPAKKSKCDGKPRCGNCAKRNEVCEYTSA